jgi:ankyrin repeat protein
MESAIRDLDGMTPLHVAASCGRAGTTRLLIQRRLDIDAINIWKQTPLHLACSNGHEQCVRHLLEAGARMDLADDITGASHLHVAVSCGKASCVAALLDRGADARAGDEAAQTPLMWAAAEGLTECAEVLLAHDPTLSRDADNAGRTALHHACRQAKNGVVRLMTDSCWRGCAGVDVQDKRGFTPLMMCASSALAAVGPCIELLLYRGANVYLRNGEDRTALELACASRHRSAINALVNFLSDGDPATVPRAPVFFLLHRPEGREYTLEDVPLLGSMVRAGRYRMAALHSMWTIAVASPAAFVEVMKACNGVGALLAVVDEGHVYPTINDAENMRATIRVLATLGGDGLGRLTHGHMAVLLGYPSIDVGIAMLHVIVAHIDVMIHTPIFEATIEMMHDMMTSDFQVVRLEAARSLGIIRSRMCAENIPAPSAFSALDAYSAEVGEGPDSIFFVPKQGPDAPLAAQVQGLSSKECSVCLRLVPASDITIAYPCGHKCMCLACSKKVVHLDRQRCPLCRSKITLMLPNFRIYE